MFVFDFPFFVLSFVTYVFSCSIPGAMHAYIMRQRKRAGSEGKRFIEDLYAQQDSSEIASFLLQSESAVDESFVRSDIINSSAVSPISQDKSLSSLDITGHDDDLE